MRTLLAAILTPFLILAAGPALAHIGHLGEVAGHGHWIALGGIAIAGAIALLGNRKKPAEASADDDTPEIEEDGEPA